MLNKPTLTALAMASAASAHSLPQPSFNPWKIEVPYESFSTGFQLNGICEFKATTADTDLNGTLTLQQDDGKAITVDGKVAGLTADTNYVVRLTTLGSLGAECTDTGDEFNPLIKLDKDGKPVEGQTLSRGKLPELTSTADGEVVLDKEELLQNLAGNNALYGKSFTVYLASELEESFTGTPVPQGCCVIGYTPRGPATEVPPPAPPIYPPFYEPYFETENVFNDFFDVPAFDYQWY